MYISHLHLKTIQSLTPDELQQVVATTITPTSWMTDASMLIRRFQLTKLYSIENVAHYNWDVAVLQKITEDTIATVAKSIPLHEHLSITLVPALPFPWFDGVDISLTTNGFTNSPTSIWIAIPPNVDLDFYQYLLAHELHHASPINPIYSLTNENFPLKEWWKMEGCAEYFSLQHFRDKRWWTAAYTAEVERRYMQRIRPAFNCVDPAVKGSLTFGAPNEQLPYMIGYSFAYVAIKHYVTTHPLPSLAALFDLNSDVVFNDYIQVKS